MPGQRRCPTNRGMNVIDRSEIPCPGTMPFSAFGANYPDTECSESLIWEPGAKPATPTLCDMDDDCRPTGPPCPYKHADSSNSQRTVSTVEDFEKLPDGALVRDCTGEDYYKSEGQFFECGFVGPDVRSAIEMVRDVGPVQVNYLPTESARRSQTGIKAWTDDDHGFTEVYPIDEDIIVVIRTRSHQADIWCREDVERMSVLEACMTCCVARDYFMAHPKAGE